MPELLRMRCVDSGGNSGPHNTAIGLCRRGVWVRRSGRPGETAVRWPPAGMWGSRTQGLLNIRPGRLNPPCEKSLEWQACRRRRPEWTRLLQQGGTGGPSARRTDPPHYLYCPLAGLYRAFIPLAVSTVNPPETYKKLLFHGKFNKK